MVMRKRIKQFLNELKQAFAAKRLAMNPKVMKTHAPFAKIIEEDESVIEGALEAIEQLDKTQAATYRPSLLFILLDRVTPIFIRWAQRFGHIREKGRSGISAHQRANLQFSQEKQKIYDFLFELNQRSGDETIFNVNETSEDAPGKQIVRQFDRQQFLEKVSIQEVQDKTRSVLTRALNAFGF